MTEENPNLKDSFLLVENNGIQGVIFVPAGTVYCGDDVVWDDRKNGPLPENVASDLGGWKVLDGALVRDSAKKTSHDQAKAAKDAAKSAQDSAKADRKNKFKNLLKDVIDPPVKQLLKAIIEELSLDK